LSTQIYRVGRSGILQSRNNALPPTSNFFSESLRRCSFQQPSSTTGGRLFEVLVIGMGLFKSPRPVTMFCRGGSVKFEGPCDSCELSPAVSLMRFEGGWEEEDFESSDSSLLDALDQALSISSVHSYGQIARRQPSCSVKQNWIHRMASSKHSLELV